MKNSETINLKSYFKKEYIF